MLCERCKKNIATVFVTKMVNDHKTEHSLCIECAKAIGGLPVNLDGPVSVDSLLKGFFHVPGTPSQRPEDDGAVCPVCGMDREKLGEKGRFGCSECYKIFDKAAARTIKHIHGRKRHIGKIPKRASGTFGMKRRLAELRTNLESHVLKEEYEDAARLRDEIRALEKELVAGEAGKDDR